MNRIAQKRNVLNLGRKCSRSLSRKQGQPLWSQHQHGIASILRFPMQRNISDCQMITKANFSLTVPGTRHHAGQKIAVPDKLRHKPRRRIGIKLSASADLVDHPFGKHRNPIGKPQCLFLVMGNVKDGDIRLVMDAADFVLNFLAQFLVQRRKRSSINSTGGS